MQLPLSWLTLLQVLGFFLGAAANPHERQSGKRDRLPDAPRVHAVAQQHLDAGRVGLGLDVARDVRPCAAALSRP